MSDRDHERDRRDDQDELRDDKGGDADKDQNGLALVGHEVDVAKCLRAPNDGSQAGKDDQERAKRRPENVPADGPHHPRTSPVGDWFVQPAEPRIGPQPVPLTSTANADSLDSSTKW